MLLQVSITTRIIQRKTVKYCCLEAECGTKSLCKDTDTNVLPHQNYWRINMDFINWAKAHLRGLDIRPSPQEMVSPNEAGYSKNGLLHRRETLATEFLPSLWDEDLEKQLRSTVVRANSTAWLSPFALTVGTLTGYGRSRKRHQMPVR